jgi:MFS family permease
MTAATISGLAMVAIAAYDSPPLVMIALAAMVGLTSPPIQAAVRTIYPTLVPRKQLTTLFSLDATAQEMIWVVGPLLATILAAQVSTGFAVLVMAVLQIFGAIMFLANREVKTVIIPKDNLKDLKDIPESVKGPLEIIAVSFAEEVLKIALTKDAHQMVNVVPVLRKEQSSIAVQ